MVNGGGKRGMVPNPEIKTSFETTALPVAVRKKMGILAIKSFAQDHLIGQASPEKLLYYTLSLPVTAAVARMPQLEHIQDNVRLAKAFAPPPPSEMKLMAATRPQKTKHALDQLKQRAADLGVGISGTGVRNNFTTADKAVREEGVRHIKEWVEVAARLGAPVIRVFADTQMRAENWESVSKGATRSQVQDWIAAALKECADHAGKYKVKIGVQNHGDFLQTAQDLLALAKAVGSPWAGPIVDTGYF